MTNDPAITALITDPRMQQRIAKYVALTCFRNSLIEDLHAGIAPTSMTSDFSDVFVRTPYGDIPWNDLSRFNDAEMKALMVDVTNRTYHFVQELFDEQRGGDLLIKLATHDPAPRWNAPA